MKEISRERKLEVAQYYVLGYPYSDIENRFLSTAPTATASTAPTMSSAVLHKPTVPLPMVRRR
jgi:hypothetical protein